MKQPQAKESSVPFSTNRAGTDPARTPLRWAIALLAAAALAATMQTARADVQVKVIITELTQLGGIDPDNTIGDFYGKVTIGSGGTQSNQPACGDDDILRGIFLPFTLFRDFNAIPDCSSKTTPWIFTDMVPETGDPISIEIEVWDNDTTSGDDKADLSDSAPDNSSLDIVLDPATGRWSGDVDWPENCSRTRQDLDQDHARVCFQVGLDSDGDGLLDGWERDGIYDDGVLTLDLPALGADPLHKDLFIELDSMSGNLPHAITINKIKEAFSLAPLNAGGTDNPDGTLGINIWIDTGGIPDPGGIEDGLGLCNDGVDNGGDGLTDAADPDCIAGDNLGGGQVLVNRDDISGLSQTFYDVKAANFDPARQYVFRYGLLSTKHRSVTTTAFADMETVAILAPVSLRDNSQNWLFNEWKGNYKVRIVSGTGAGQVRNIDANSSSRLTVDKEWDTIPDATSEYRLEGVGGLGEVGGNDFIVFNNARESVQRRSSLMHEVGHTLGLRHGGDETHNCKPNYVSIMNYDHPGIANLVGARIFDYSPPRYGDAVGRSLPLSPLDENNLDERIPLDPNDDQNFFVFKCLTVDGEDGDDGVEDSCSDGEDNDGDELVDAADSDCYTPKLWQLNEPVDWDATEALCEGAADNMSVVSNIDFGGPGDCRKADPNGELGEIDTHDDWTNITLSFIEDGDAQDAPVGELPSEWTIEEQDAYTAELESTDISITKTGSPDPVEVGENLVYTLTVSNIGPQPAFLIDVTDVLPGSVSYLGDAAQCVEEPLGELSCDLGTILAGAQKQFDVTVSTADVCSDGLPQQLVNVATVLHGENGGGPDPDPTNNAVEYSITPVDTTPPVIESLSVSPEELWAPDHQMQPVTVSATASDLCDAEPVCRIASIASNEPPNARGDGNTDVDAAITGELTAELRAERSGIGGGRVYTITTECSDASGNVASDTVTVAVAHDQR